MKEGEIDPGPAGYRVSSIRMKEGEIDPGPLPLSSSRVKEWEDPNGL